MPKNIEELYEQSEKEGNKAAKARNLTREVLLSTITPSEMTASDFQPIAVDLLSSGDPEAVFELSGLMGENSKLRGTAAGTSMAAAAWKLAACDLGLDCSYGSALLRGFCLNGGIYCANGDLRANMSASEFSPDAFARVQQLEQVIYKAVVEGNVASLFN